MLPKSLQTNMIDVLLVMVIELAIIILETWFFGTGDTL